MTQLSSDIDLMMQASLEALTLPSYTPEAGAPLDALAGSWTGAR